MGLLDKAKDAAGKAAEKAKQATAAGKEKLDDVRLQRKIDDVCEEIGKIVVAQRRGEAVVDADSVIDAKVAEIAALEQQIADNSASGSAGTGTTGE